MSNELAISNILIDIKNLKEKIKDLESRLVKLEEPIRWVEPLSSEELDDLYRFWLAKDALGG